VESFKDSSSVALLASVSCRIVGARPAVRAPSNGFARYDLHSSEAMNSAREAYRRSGRLPSQLSAIALIPPKYLIRAAVIGTSSTMMPIEDGVS